MIVDGLGTMIGALFGNTFGTTVYIGHSTYKIMNAKCGYVIINGIFILILCFTGILPLVFEIFSEESI